MRVIAGEARSLRLIAPEGLDVRPTTDRIKETLFNMINPYIYGSEFLDIFGGSGSIGIEALSRGAREVTFIENNRKAIESIESNLKHTKLIDKSFIYKQDFLVALKSIKQSNKTFDIIFLDPPYEKSLEEMAISQIYEDRLLKEDGIIVCESSAKTSFEFMDRLDDYEIYKEKVFRITKFTFIRYKRRN